MANKRKRDEFDSKHEAEPREKKALVPRNTWLRKPLTPRVGRTPYDGHNWRFDDRFFDYGSVDDLTEEALGTACSRMKFVWEGANFGREHTTDLCDERDGLESLDDVKNEVWKASGIHTPGILQIIDDYAHQWWLDLRDIMRELRWFILGDPDKDPFYSLIQTVADEELWLPFHDHFNVLLGEPEEDFEKGVVFVRVRLENPRRK